MLRYVARLVFLLVSLLPISSLRKILSSRQFLYAKNLSQKKIFVDVSIIKQKDSKTGIQRVVRALSKQLMSQVPVEYSVYFVYSSKRTGYMYSVVPQDLDAILSCNDGRGSEKISPNAGDIFLGLDLATSVLPYSAWDLMLWKLKGVQIYFFVYDILPLLHPNWFSRKGGSNFKIWMRVIVIFSNKLICHSVAVKNDLNNLLKKNFNLNCDELPVEVIPLGADINESCPSMGLSENEKQTVDRLVQQKFVLLVGTLEPRKGHSDILKAYEYLWSENEQCALVFVGRSGWKTEGLQEKILSHHLVNEKLFWFSQASDELLDILYRNCYGVVLASYGEGFGLPLVEAIQYKKPVLARSIPVFHELGKNEITYFENHMLASTLRIWLYEIPKIPEIDITHLTWVNSVKQLKTVMFS